MVLLLFSFLYRRKKKKVTKKEKSLFSLRGIASLRLQSYISPHFVSDTFRLAKKRKSPDRQTTH
jgi:hypothetical protein